MVSGTILQGWYLMAEGSWLQSSPNRVAPIMADCWWRLVHMLSPPISWRDPPVEPAAPSTIGNPSPASSACAKSPAREEKHVSRQPTTYSFNGMSVCVHYNWVFRVAVFKMRGGGGGGLWNNTDGSLGDLRVRPLDFSDIDSIATFYIVS